LNQDVAALAQVLVVVGTFAAAMVALAFVVRVLFYPRRSSAQVTESQAPRVDDSRFARLEEAVDSIAIEVERIAEAQRFSAKLMSERLPERLLASTPERAAEK
jgi:flagellar biosynthesis/type III secretory pathway M-ring protein FliF/YscJ